MLSGSAHAESSINTGLSGNWFNPETPGQGIIRDVIPSRQELVIGWYAFEVDAALAIGASEQRWLTAVGEYAGGRAELTIHNTSGGTFNSSRPAQTLPASDATLIFEDCRIDASCRHWPLTAARRQDTIIGSRKMSSR